MVTLIKTIFFDFDGVLTTDSNGSTTVCSNLQKAIPELSFDDLYRCYRKNHSQLLLGKATYADIWNDFCACLGKQVDISLLPEILKNAPKNEQMFTLCEALKQHYKIGIITDNPKERLHALIKRMKLDELFPILILSADVGAKKNKSPIFEEALRAANANAQECVFIDNQQRNLVIPSEMGFHTFCHDDVKNDLVPLLQQLKEWGIVVQ